MKRLYDTKGHLKQELVQDALNKARLGGRLPNLSEIRIEKFAEKFTDELNKSRIKVGKLVTKDEVEYVTSRMRRDKHDGLRDKDIQALEEIILDPDANVR
ncbi:MAG: hypothetical protein U9O55_04405 [Patescibacteria group bacterium]|nr:hypothetical protein [Patescibacteria group bacterium]